MSAGLALWGFGDGGMVAGGAAQGGGVALARRPSVADVLRAWGPWVCCMALLGVCEDGIPLAARFYDPRRNGHYVFFADDVMAQTALVEPVLYSVVVQGRRYSRKMAAGGGYGPERWSFVVFSDDAMAWDARVRDAAHCGGVYSPAGGDGVRAAGLLADAVRRRLAGGALGAAPVVLVVLHDLGSFWEGAAEEVREALLTVALHGREAGVFLLTTVRYDDAARLPEALLRGRRLFGRAGRALPNWPAFRAVAGAGVDLSGLPVGAGVVRADGAWMRYVAPMI